MDFNDLPSELTEAIASRLSPEDMARFFAASKEIRERSYLPEFQQQVANRRKYVSPLKKKGELLKKSLIKEAYDEDFLDYYDNDPSVRIVSGQLKPLLSQRFPQFQGRAVATAAILEIWFHIYLYMNKLVEEDLSEDMYIFTFKVDAILASLSNSLNWKEGQLKKDTDLIDLARLHLGESVQVPPEIADHLAFIERYFRKVMERLQWHFKTHRRDIPSYDEYLDVIRFGHLQSPP